MDAVDEEIRQTFICIQRKISGLVAQGKYTNASELVSSLDQLRIGLENDEIGRVFIDKVNLIKLTSQSREEVDNAQAAQNAIKAAQKEIESRKEEVARLTQEREAEKKERARLEADNKVLKEKESLSDEKIKTLEEKVDQLHKKLINLVPSDGVVTKDEHTRTQALLEEAQLQLKQLQGEQNQAKGPQSSIQPEKSEPINSPKLMPSKKASERKKQFTDCGANVDISDKDNKTALHYAAEKGHTATVTELIESEAKVLINAKDNDDKTALHYAAEKGHTEIVEQLLPHIVNPRGEDRFTNTAMKYALRGNHIDVINKLIEKGIYPENAEIDYYKREHKESDEKIKGLIKTLDKIRNATYYKDSAEKQFDHMKNFIKRSDTDTLSKIKSLYRQATTIFNYTDRKAINSIETFYIAAFKRMDKSQKDSEGNNLLHIAAKHGNFACLEILLNHFYQGNTRYIRKKNNEGKTPLTIALEKGHDNCSNLLTAHLKTNYLSEETILESRTKAITELNKKSGEKYQTRKKFVEKLTSRF